jgi:signal peptidase I
VLRTAVRLLVGVALAALLVLALERWVAKPYRIDSASMEPALHCARPGPGCRAGTSDGVLANRLVYRLRAPRRGEVVVARAPAAARRQCGVGGTLVKRLIGLPGETVSERDGFVSVDGRRLREPYLDLFERDHAPRHTWRVPRGDYFLMGDNRAASCDSREFGPVARRDILGRAALIYWPPGRIGASIGAPRR